MADMSEPSSLLERLISSRNRDLSMFLPFFLALTNDISTPDPDQDSENPDQETGETPATPSSGDRIILINPLTQGMVVIEGSSSGLDSLLRDLLSKDGQPPASKASIEAMSRVEIREGDDEDGECVICLEEWGVGDVATEMPCKHRFHGECAEKWLGIHGSCPICRFKMPVDDDQDLGKKIEEEEEEEEGEIRGGRGRRRRRREIWVSFSIRNEESSQTGSSLHRVDVNM